MPCCIKTVFRKGVPTLQICDVTCGSVRLAREISRHDACLSEEEVELLQLHREEARHDFLRRQFLLTSERYLKGELSAPHGEGTERLNAG